LLKEREQKFLRNRVPSSERKIEPQDRDQVYPPRDYGRPTRGFEHSPRQHENSPRIQEEQPRPQQYRQRETKTIQVSPLRHESPRDTYSIAPPESAYFKVDEPSIEQEPEYEPHKTPKTENTKAPEVGSTFDKKARDSRQFEEIDESDRSPQFYKKTKRNEHVNRMRPEGYPYGTYPLNRQHILPYPPPAMQYPTPLPQNVVYQTPDGKLLAFQHHIPVANTQKRDFVNEKDNDTSESRTDMTPVRDRIDEEDEGSSIVDHSRSDNDDLRRHQFYPLKPTNAVIPPYHKPVGSKYVGAPSKLSELYKMREDQYPARNLRQLTPERQVDRDVYPTDYQPRNILGQTRNAVAQPQDYRGPKNTATAKGAVRPDPIDIDDGLEASQPSQPSQRAAEPEDLQRAVVSGLRKPVNEPMSLNRFRHEFKDEVGAEQPDSDDIDRVSDSNYSIVEQAYKDMDDFDLKVEEYDRVKHQRYGRVADARAFGQKSHNSVFAPQKQPKNKIRY
jgi:hypothetical protein